MWGDAEAVSGPVADFVRDLKAGPGGTSASTAASSWRSRSLPKDSWTSCSWPSVRCCIPTGRRLFERLDDLRRFDLLSATPTPSGSVWLSYRVA